MNVSNAGCSPADLANMKVTVKCAAVLLWFKPLTCAGELSIWILNPVMPSFTLLSLSHASTNYFLQQVTKEKLTDGRSVPPNHRNAVAYPSTMSDSDLKEHALNSSHDFYDLLGLSSAAQESEIKRAYRKTALKYHPDKVGASNTEAIEKFHLLQIAYDVLLDENVRQLYDNARRAREEKKEREAAYEGRRRVLKEELERRESAGAAGLKRKREDAQEEEAFQRELKRLAADGARRRKEREDQLRKEARDEYEKEQNEQAEAQTSDPPRQATGAEEIDRTISLRYPTDLNISRDALSSRFSHFGQIQETVLRTKKIKIEGEKHRKEYTTAIIVYESIVGAHAAVSDFPRLAANDDTTWTVFENVNWASGKEPDCIPKTQRSKPSPAAARNDAIGDAEVPKTPLNDRIRARINGDAEPAGGGAGGLRKVPSFGSFKGTPKTATATPNKAAVASPSMEELTMIRLKNAERRRLAEKLRKEEEAEDQEAATAAS